LQHGSRSIHYGLVTKEYANVAKNYRIGEGKVLEYMRESTGGEAANSGASRSRGGTGRSHSMSSHEDFSHDGY
jgi:hypothetical protein